MLLSIYQYKHASHLISTANKSNKTNSPLNHHNYSPLTPYPTSTSIHTNILFSQLITNPPQNVLPHPRPALLRHRRPPRANKLPLRLPPDSPPARARQLAHVQGPGQGRRHVLSRRRVPAGVAVSGQEPHVEGRDLRETGVNAWGVCFSYFMWDD